MTEATRTAILYARVSTRAQSGEGYSLRQHVEALLGWPEAEAYLVALGQLGVEPRSARASRKAGPRSR